MRSEEGIIHRSRRLRWTTLSEVCMILQIIRKPNSRNAHHSFKVFPQLQNRWSLSSITTRHAHIMQRFSQHAKLKKLIKIYNCKKLIYFKFQKFKTLHLSSSLLNRSFFKTIATSSAALGSEPGRISFFV